MLELSVLFASNSSQDDLSKRQTDGNLNSFAVFNGTVGHFPISSSGASASPSSVGLIASASSFSASGVDLFESEQGCSLVKQFLELAQVVAVSTPATSPTAYMQAMITQKYAGKINYLSFL